MNHKKTTPDVRSNLIKQLRDEGYTLQVIGDKFNLTRERIRQILEQHYGSTVMTDVITKNKMSQVLGCSVTRLNTLERKGILRPLHDGYVHVYDKVGVEKARAGLMNHPIQKVERICKVCGGKFYVRPSEIRPTSPRIFCSNKCFGSWFGRHYGRGMQQSQRNKIEPTLINCIKWYFNRLKRRIHQ